MQISLELIISLIAGIMSIALAWGVATQKVKQLSEEVLALRVGAAKDRDLLVEIKTKMDLLLQGKVINEKRDKK